MRCCRPNQIGPDAAGRVAPAALRVDRVRVAVDLEGLVLGRRHDVAHRDLGRQAGQHVTSPGSTDTLYQSGTPESEEDLFDVVGRQPLGVGQFPRGDGRRTLRPRRARCIEMMREYSVQVVTRMAPISPNSERPSRISVDQPPAGMGLPPGTPISVMARRSRTSSSSFAGQQALFGHEFLDREPRLTASFASFAASA